MLVGFSLLSSTLALWPTGWASWGQQGPSVILHWDEGGVEYEWDAAHTKEEYEKTGRYIQAQNAVAGLKVDPSSTPTNTTLYITIPRWLTGVPSTLNVVKNVNLKEGLKNPLLAPWPTWEWQAMHTETGNCDTLQYVQSMEIDRNGLMWVIDSGRMNVFEKNQSLVDNTCPPKILIFDTKTGEQVDEAYVLPTDVADYDSSLLNDIVVDTDANVAYISSVFGTGDIYLYNRTARKSYRFYEKSMNANTGFTWVIDDVKYSHPIWSGAAEDGIALTADGKWLYYSPLTNPQFFRVRTADLWEKVQGPVAGVGAKITGPYQKSSPSDGMTFGCDGTLVYGGLTSASVYTYSKWSLFRKYVWKGEWLLAENDETMNWVDTFAWGPDDALWFSVNHLDKLFSDGVQAPVYIQRVPKGRRIRGSYIKGPCPCAYKGE